MKIPLRLKVIVLLLVINSNYSCKNKKSTTNRQNIEVAVETILSSIYKGNVEEINTKYIHPIYGLYDITRIGAMDNYSFLYSIPQEETKDVFSLYQYLFSSDNSKNITLIWEDVFFNCDDFSWDKNGVFVSKEHSYPSVTKIMRNQEHFEEASFSDKAYKDINFIEENSIKVVDTENDLILFFTKIENKWYLTMVDRVTTDCSA